MPEWFKYKASKSSIIVELHNISDIVDLFFCLVLSFSEMYSKIFLECTCYFEGFELARSQEQVYVRMKSDNVFIWNRYVGANSGMVHRVIKSTFVN